MADGVTYSGWGYVFLLRSKESEKKMINIFSKLKIYSKGFIDATLIGAVVVMTLAYMSEKKTNKCLTDRVDEQASLIQRFGWPRTRNECARYSKVPKGKTVSDQKPTNPIGFY